MNKCCKTSNNNNDDDYYEYIRSTNNNDASFQYQMNNIFNRYDYECIEIQKLLKVLKRIYYNDTTLTICNLNHCNLNRKGTIALSIALQYNTNIVILFLENNNISSIMFISYLIPILVNHVSIQYLYLSYNSISTNGCIALATKFKNCRKDTQQQKSCNNNSGYSSNYSINNRCKLQLIKLSYINITSSGAIELLKYVPDSVHTISFNGNPIDNNDALSIAECLRFNTTIQHLDLIIDQSTTSSSNDVSSTITTRNNDNIRDLITPSCPSLSTESTIIDSFCSILQNDNRTLATLSYKQPTTSQPDFFCQNKYQVCFKTEEEELLFILLRLNKIGRKYFGSSEIDQYSWCSLIEHVTYGNKNHGTWAGNSNKNEIEEHSHTTVDKDNINNVISTSGISNIPFTPKPLNENVNETSLYAIEDMLSSKSNAQTQEQQQQHPPNFTSSTQMLQQSIPGNPNLIFSVLKSRPDLLV